MEIHKPKFVTGFIEEILVIVIGISLAVMAERIVEYYQHHKEEKGVVKRMIVELRRDSSDLVYNIKYHQKALDADSLLTRWSRREIELPSDSLTIYASRSLVFTFFASSTAEIEALKGSGKLYLIEDHDLLSSILKHYDRYSDFKLTTDLSIHISQRLSDIYKENALLNTNIFNIQKQEDNYQFNAQDLEKNLRGNKKYENLLQEKRVYDAFVIQQSKQALNRLTKITQSLIKEE
jgi:hypothetical protein